jgi:hypothetical protein
MQPVHPNGHDRARHWRGAIQRLPAEQRLADMQVRGSRRRLVACLFVRVCVCRSPLRATVWIVWWRIASHWQMQPVLAYGHDRARHWRGTVQGLPAAAASRHAGKRKQYFVGCLLAGVPTYVCVCRSPLRATVWIVWW